MPNIKVPREYSKKSCSFVSVTQQVSLAETQQSNTHKLNQTPSESRNGAGLRAPNLPSHPDSLHQLILELFLVHLGRIFLADG